MPAHVASVFSKQCAVEEKSDNTQAYDGHNIEGRTIRGHVDLLDLLNEGIVDKISRRKLWPRLQFNSFVSRKETHNIPSHASLKRLPTERPADCRLEALWTR